MDVFIRFFIYLHSFHKLNCYFVEICDEVAHENVKWFVAYNFQTCTLESKMQII